MYEERANLGDEVRFRFILFCDQNFRRNEIEFSVLIFVCLENSKRTPFPKYIDIFLLNVCQILFTFIPFTLTFRLFARKRKSPVIIIIINCSMDSETKYKLTYFPVKAIAEPIRYLLCYGNLKFEDVRLNPDSWKSFKETTPYGQVPILEIDDHVAHQSIAICRYLATVVGLSGENALENLEIDSIVDTIADFRNHVGIYNKEDNNSPIKSVLRETLMNETLPYYLKRFEKKASGGYIALGRLSWADLYFISLLDYCNGVLKIDVLEGYPNLIELRKKIIGIPAIKEWIENRPSSDY